jgi:hypothetical protein
MPGAPKVRISTVQRFGLHQTLKRFKGYSDDGDSGSDGDGGTACRQAGWQWHVDNDDFLDSDKDNNQKEIQWRMMDEIFLPPVTLLRRTGGGLLQTGTKNDGGGASDDDNIEDDIGGLGGWGSLLIDNKDDRTGRATTGDDNSRMRPATTMMTSWHSKCIETLYYITAYRYSPRHVKIAVNFVTSLNLNSAERHILSHRPTVGPVFLDVNSKFEERVGQEFLVLLNYYVIIKLWGCLWIKHGKHCGGVYHARYLFL